MRYPILYPESAAKQLRPPLAIAHNQVLFKGAFSDKRDRRGNKPTLSLHQTVRVGPTRGRLQQIPLHFWVPGTERCFGSELLPHSV